MKTLISLTVVLMAALFIVGCSAAQPAVNDNNEDSIADQNAEQQNLDIDQTEDEVVITADVDEDLDADVQITVDTTEDEPETTEVVLEIEDVDPVAAEDFCEIGSTFTYESDDGNVDAEILGLTSYNGQELCEGFSVTAIESPVGTILTETTYYFDNTFSEYWIVTKTSGAGMPEQVNEIHLIDGEVQ